MPESNRPLAAVHYFYLLRGEEDDLGRLWARLTGGGAGQPVQAPPLSLPDTEDAGHCQIVQRTRGLETDYCLALLPDLAMAQAHYRVPGHPDLEDRWRAALELIEADRQRAAADDFTPFGETTVVITSQISSDYDAVINRFAEGGSVFSGRLDPGVAGGGEAALSSFPGRGGRTRDFWALAAADTDRIVFSLFPAVDSLQKQLSHTAAFLDEQRKTIMSERAGVDREVGALLHRQVVTAPEEETDTQSLERQIEALSRMFGVLATDTLLVRQSGDRIEQDVDRLRRAMMGLMGAEGAGALGAHYLSGFEASLEAARDEARNLDFSRQSAQAAIEVVRTRVELLRAGEEAAIQEQTRELLQNSLTLEEERLTLQVAAGFVEMVLVFYYVLKAWEGVAGQASVERLAPFARLLVVGAFSLAATLATHFLAGSIRKRSIRNPGLWISAAVLVLSFAAMVILSIVTR